MGGAALNAEQLLEHFAVYGRFYEKKIAGISEQLRDRLEIAPVKRALNAVVRGEPDLLVVMMNPGGSRPLDALWDNGGESGFVAAQPDRTQYQIMRLLLLAQESGLPWFHARILNLSDLRTPKSSVFMDKLSAYGADDSHSLFSKSRVAQCKAVFEHVATPVLCAWGLSPQFGSLASSALAAAAGHPLLGLSDDGLAYRHPLPQRHDFQLQWLAQLKEQLASFKMRNKARNGSDSVA